MLETIHGKYELLENRKNAFDLKVFEEKFIEEIYVKYSYILGDLSDGILRLKGFSSTSKSKNSYLKIPDYLHESCAYECPYFVLKKVVEKD